MLGSAAGGLQLPRAKRALLGTRRLQLPKPIWHHSLTALALLAR